MVSKDLIKISLILPLICFTWFYFGVIMVIDIWGEYIDGIPLLIAPIIVLYLSSPILKYKITIKKKEAGK